MRVTTANRGKSLESVVVASGGTETLFAVDPSSTRMGVAIYQGERLHSAYVLKPDRASDDAQARVDSMLRELAELLAETPPTHAVLEQPTMLRPGRNIKIACLLHHTCGEARRVLMNGGAVVSMVQPAQWNGNRRKTATQATVAATTAGYDAGQDKGGDASDAIAMGRWWLMIGRHRTPMVKGKRKRA